MGRFLLPGKQYWLNGTILETKKGKTVPEFGRTDEEGGVGYPPVRTTGASTKTIYSECHKEPGMSVLTKIYVMVRRLLEKPKAPRATYTDNINVVVDAVKNYKCSSEEETIRRDVLYLFNDEKWMPLV